ncbi:hypothetical protein ABZ883_10235 [Streptomyces sp. NPDC046977]|uniref:hypothetical protein n=1 Tax=Streptomyces sp. NPDC046977 TaxID=3154703 RepID=UPI003407A57A
MARSDVARGARRRPGRRRAVAVVSALVAAAGLAAAGYAVTSGTHARGDSPARTASAATTTVVRTDLSDSRTHRGVLGFGPGITVKGAGTGTVTELPSTGSTVKRGRQLYAVDDRPVMVFYGSTPLFRTLDKPTLRGRDVTVVADNMEALGYDIGPRTNSGASGPYTGGSLVDRTGDVYTRTLAAAVKRWQKRVGMTPTGRLEVGQIVVLPGPVRVGAVTAQLGDPVAGPLMTVTRTTKAVSVPVPATDTDGITKGAHVTITLPDSREIPGTVTAISQSVQGGGDSPVGENTPPTLDVTVAPSVLPKYDTANVEVRFTSVARKHVLAVPVGALVALSGGGYAVQRTDGGYLAVTTGLYASGMVEVSGTGLTEGLRVVTAS